MSGGNRHVMFADCFHDISDCELMEEHARVLPLSSSHWRTAVLIEVVERGLVERPPLRNDRS